MNRKQRPYLEGIHYDSKNRTDSPLSFTLIHFKKQPKSFLELKMIDLGLGYQSVWNGSVLLV